MPVKMTQVEAEDQIFAKTSACMCTINGSFHLVQLPWGHNKTEDDQSICSIPEQHKVTIIVQITPLPP